MDIKFEKSSEVFNEIDKETKCSNVPVLLSKVSTTTKYVHVTGRDDILSQLYDAATNPRSRCVLIEGESGCGKTKVLQVLAHMCNRSIEDTVTLHIGEQLDSKVLVGTFTCSGMPGEFIWLPGVLTRSVLAGKWVFLEDIDHAPSDVLALLLPLVKDGKLVLPGYSSPVYAAKGFKLFATRRLSSQGVRLVGQNTALLSVLENHMVKFSIPQYTLDDLAKIIGAQYPSVVTVLSSITSGSNENVGLRQLLSLGPRLVNSIHNGRIVEIDDLMLELLDVLAGDLPSEEHLKVALELRSICGGISSDKIEFLCTKHKPAVQVAKTSFAVGRSYLKRVKEINFDPFFAYTRSSLLLLERVCRCVQLNEPVLLVGETGVGKTAAVGYLATITGNRLVTMNLSQQTDSTDLLGGFKPIQLSQMLGPMRETFDELFCSTFDTRKTNQFLSNVQAVIVEKNWKKLLDVYLQSVKVAMKKLKGKGGLVRKWRRFEQDVKRTRKQLDLPQASLAFQFVEGALVEAVRKGWWVLLDEVNLASPEALQCLNCLLEGPHGTFLLTEKLDSQSVERHPDFRLFCCMNPATDVGKRSLPPNVRNRFTEFYVDELKDPADLRILVTRYLSDSNVTPPIINGIIKFYNGVRELANTKLQDGTGRRPHYSLRTLCRSLYFAATNPCKNLLRSLYEGFLMSFLTQLKFDHYVVISTLARQALGIPQSTVSAPLPRPKEMGVVQVEGFWLEVGTEPPNEPTGYVITDSVRSNLKNLARIVFGRRLPILLQGPTSAGKTSLIRYLACLTGHKCLRVNNHEHTDLQEYVGMYSAGPDGQLMFQEGVLVQAMRNGYWIILDELNLAPTDVLEALNRVLDDNRELFIPETQEVIKAHPNFMLFGTQNPPGVYGGRKVLSRAFRNRFVELHFEDIPSNELIHILNQCSALPETYAKKMVAVMKNLQQRRSLSGVFEGKYGLITLRDLFRWAGRYRLSSVREKFYDWEQHLAEDGFMLLSGKLRNTEEILVIKEVIEKHFKRPLNQSNLFGGRGGLTTSESIAILGSPLPDEFRHIVWTPELMRMGVLVHRAVKFQEPVLLVGNTGCGKTSLCQLLMRILGRQLYIVNCHMHTEAADFLGGLRPVRNRSEDMGEEGDDPLALFEWADGVLVKGMKEGGCVLLDEISLAEDAVLERLNSVLEPDRKLLVAERGKHKEEVYEVVARDDFLLLATMNPGGDYGKKELSPALRNRFVEIWCQDVSTTTGYRMIIEHNLSPQIKELFPWSSNMLEFIDWLRKLSNSNRESFTTRDIIMWITFINKVTPPLSPPTSFYHGAQSMFIDAIGCGGCGFSERILGEEKCLELLGDLAVEFIGQEYGGGVEITENSFGINPFYIERGPLDSSVGHYCLSARGPLRNAFRLLRAMQLGRPLMLEGDPGVGKTSIVSALAAAGGHPLTRINLSEHTDISDLFGSDLPTEGEGRMKFTWRDGPFLKALKNSEWILLDEMNLASQSVLEGLNACLDHRGEVFIPELNKVFSVPVGTRLFACQNPYRDGGGRKGLPKSFVNRFIQVYMEAMSHDDLVTITCSLYPEMDQQMIEKMVTFNSKVKESVCLMGDIQGCDFNLRDILRWCELIRNGGGDYKKCLNNPGEWINLLYLYRIRDIPLREKILSIYCELFGKEFPSLLPPGQNFLISNNKLQIGSTCVTRGHYRHGDDISTDEVLLLPCQVPLMEAILQSLSMNWMTILVGGSCSGKSSLVKSLARLSGTKLLEYPMNTATDTMELLGGFEQVNMSRHCCNLVCSLVGVAECMRSEGEDDPRLMRIINSLRPFAVPRVTPEAELDANDLTNQILDTKTAVQELLHIAQETDSKYTNDLSLIVCQLDQLMMKAQGGVAQGGQFEWVDSLLVQAITQGHWMLLSHANFCSPSVLDRLNPLFEPNPILTIDEVGVVDGRVLTVAPHPEFRLFLTLDPANGEISRALRNRGVEIVILDQDVHDLHSSLQSPSVYPRVNELSLSPVVTMVTRDIQPFSELIARCIDNSAQNIEDILEIDCSLKAFINGASVVDYNARGVALRDMYNKLPNGIMRVIVQSGVIILGDVMYTDTVNQIRDTVELVLGCRYDGYVDYRLNNRVTGIVECFPASEHVQILEKLDSLMLYCTVKRLSLVHQVMNTLNKEAQNATLSSAGSLTKGTFIKLSAFMSNLLSALLESTMNTQTVPKLSIQRDRAVAVLTVFVYLFHSPRTLSLFGVAWNMFKQHCLQILIPCLDNRESLSVQLDSLSELDSLVPNELNILNKLRELMGGPAPPTSLEHLQLMLSLEESDNRLVQSVPLAPPLYLLAPPTSQSRKELLLRDRSNQCDTPTDPAHCATPTDPTPVFSCVTLPALYELRAMLQGAGLPHPLLDYCMSVPHWPIRSLETINKGCGFLPLLELSHADSHLQSLNSSLIGHCHGNASSTASLTTLCHSSLTSSDKGKPLITLGDYNEKMRGLHCLYQFLWVQGFCVVQDCERIISQGYEVLKTCIRNVMNAFMSTVTNNEELNEEHNNMSALLLTLAADKYTGQRWKHVHFHMEALSSLQGKDEGSVLGSRQLGEAKVHLGLALCALFAPTHLLDPLEIKRAETEFIDIMERYTCDVMRSHDSHMTHLSSATWSQLYPIVNSTNGLKEQHEYWSTLKKQSQDQVIIRLIPEKFDDLVSYCRDVLVNLCHYDKVQSLLSRTSNNSSTVWERSVLTALHQLRDRFPSYPDLVQPFTASMTVLLDGVNFLLEHDQPMVNTAVTACVPSLVQFPFVSDEADSFGGFGRIEVILGTVEVLMKSGKKWTLLKRLLLVAVDIALSLLYSSTPVGPKCDSVFTRIFELCYQAWEIADQKQKEREKEENSLYRYKARTVDISDENSEDNIETALSEAFPNYEKDFEQTENIHEEPTNENTTRESDDTCEQFDVQESSKIRQLHKGWLTSHVTTNHVTSLDRHTSFVNMYSIGGELINEMGGAYKPGLADIGGHILANRDVLSMNTDSQNQSSRNIYKDPNISEAKRAQPVIKELIKRVQDVLEEWPDYPILIQIMASCNVVLSLGVSEPLMKLITGLELVLRKAQDWESYASSRLSLSKPLGALSALILEWRKKELSYWSNLLEITRADLETKACQWWFHLYGLYKEGVAVGGANVLLEGLQQLMETSTVGEYTIRLSLLQSFSIHCYKGGDQSVGDMFHSVYKYYCQFLSAVENHLKEIAHPAEKEFKEHLAIMRWNDGNYWAIKQASEKSHRTLLHFIKKYHGILNQSVRAVLTANCIQERKQHGHLLQIVNALTTGNRLKPAQHEVTSQSPAFPLDIVLSGGLTLTLAECCSRMSILFDRFVSHGTYTGLCIQLDEFISDVIESYHELQRNDSVSNDGDKDKRAVAVKLLLMRRRRALSDLIKKLKQYGLSHRKGEELSNDLYLLPFTQPLSMTTPISNDYDHYFYLSIARMVAMVTIMANPNKELSLYHVSCIKGYSRQLLKWICEERFRLGNDLTQLTELRKSVEIVKQLLETDVAHGVLLNDFNAWQSKLRGHLCHCLEAITDTDRLVGALPPSLDLSLTPVPSDRLPLLLTTPANHVTVLGEWKRKVSEFIDTQLPSITDTQSFVTSKGLQVLQEGYQMLEMFSSQAVPEFLNETLGESQTSTHGIFDYLAKLMSFLCQSCSDFTHWMDSIASPSYSNTEVDQCESVKVVVEPLVKSLMVGVQRIMEREKEMKQKGADNDDIPLISDAYNATIANTGDLNIKNVNAQIRTLLNIIGTQPIPKPTLTSLITGLLPIIETYRGLAMRTVEELQLCHRTMGKTTSIMLEIFTNLLAKGFCTPPEFSEEEGMEGSEFMDIEAGGFDEGEGSKNVNDKVDQDNLEPGGNDKDGDKNEREEKGNDEEDNAFEMEEDFEGRIEDLEKQNKEGKESESGDEDNDELDKRMGEVDKGEEGEGEDEEEEELDRNLWAPEEEEEEQDLNKESGGGTSMEEETQLVAKEDSKRKKGDPKDEGEGPQADPVSDEEGVVNDIDEYFESGRDTRQNEDGEQGEDENDFGELNIEDEADEHVESEEEMTNKDGEENASEDGSEDMEVADNPPPDNPDKENGEEGEEEEEGGGDGHTQEMEDGGEEEDVDMESRSYCNSDTVYGVPQTQSTETNDQQQSNSDIKDANNDDTVNDSNETPNSVSGTLTTATEQDNGSVVPVPSTGKVKNRSRRKYPKDDHAPNPVSESVNRPVKRARIMESATDGESKDERNQKDTETKDSTQFQYVSEDQPSSNLAWDAASNLEGGINPLGEKPTPDEEQGEEGEEEGQGTTNNEVPQANEYHLSNTCEDGVVDNGEDMDTSEHEETRKGREEEEWVKPTESFFANADTSAWSDKTVNESTLRESLKTAVEVLQRNPSASHDSVQLWLQYETLTSPLSHALCEELRLILQPTQASKLKGDFRTGKRLNMRRIIPYIASNFQNDRIWLRRSKPSKREYQILLAVDDSSSMKENNCNQMAYESLAVISTALQKLECGQLGICRFGESMELLHPLDSPFSASDGGHLLHNLTFSQNRTNFVQLIKNADSLFSKSVLQGNKTSTDISQLLVVLSDGRGVYADGTQAIESGVRKLTEMGVFVVFIILDGLAKDSIVDIKVPIFVPGQPPVIKSYLETFPFSFYIVLRDTQRLPLVLGESLRQWFELVTMNS